MKKQDNLVPSISKKHIEALNAVYQESQCRDEESRKLVEEAIQFLENGVETNNGQPNLGLFEPSKIDIKSIKSFIEIKEEDDHLG